MCQYVSVRMYEGGFRSSGSETQNATSGAMCVRVVALFTVASV